MYRVFRRLSWYYIDMKIEITKMSRRRTVLSKIEIPASRKFTKRLLLPLLVLAKIERISNTPTFRSVCFWETWKHAGQKKLPLPVTILTFPRKNESQFWCVPKFITWARFIWNKVNRIPNPLNEKKVYKGQG